MVVSGTIVCNSKAKPKDLEGSQTFWQSLSQNPLIKGCGLLVLLILVPLKENFLLG